MRTAGPIESRDFESPFEVKIPPGCEGWEEMYPHHLLFGEDRRAFEESRLWFQDGMHAAEPLFPFDAMTFECGVVALNQANARLFVVPPSLGVECRVLNGYVYVSANSVTDEATLARRAELFARRGGYYYEHWDELYERWVDKVTAATTELQALVVPELQEFEDESIVTEGAGLGSSHALLQAYDRLLEGIDRIFQYHFEFLNLGYWAYLVFYELCREAFPEIPDQTIAKMVSGIEVLVLRPDDELRRLARLALELGVTDAIKRAGSEDELVALLAGSDAGERWLADLEQTKDPWFYFSCGTGVFHHHHRSWIDEMTFPIRTIGSYIARLEAGDDISRPYEAALAERERITEEHRSLLSEEMRQAFDEGLVLARTVFPYVENHNFYIDHRYLTIFWNKVREFGALLVRHVYLADLEDIFYLRRDEVRSALEELRLDWSSGAGVARGPGHWPAVVDRRKPIHAEMRAWAPPPALGRVPDAITDPITVMLWGITTERLQEWLSSDDSGALTGCPASPGVVEGPARVLLGADQLGELEEGEILVAPSTSTSWTPIFHRIAAAVLDTGGIMCHAAIVAREYGLPAVVGTGTATKRIKTGDRLRVDASKGVVTIL
ncbi:MAG TPA: PEP-utilizing enzyme [Gaiellaceae bacterium]|nr:PEP-utilizing enzyme [Gaiellaceae bacterium]